MLANRIPATDANDNDRLMALLAYVFTPIWPVVILLVESMKSRPYQRYHAVQSLAVGVVVVVLWLVLGWTCFLSCVPLVLQVVAIYYGIVAYQGTGAYFEIPMLTQFMKQQKWM